jgi:hypothetical protein
VVINVGSGGGIGLEDGGEYDHRDDDKEEDEGDCADENGGLALGTQFSG